MTKLAGKTDFSRGDLFEKIKKLIDEQFAAFKASFEEMIVDVTLKDWKLENENRIKMKPNLINYEENNLEKTLDKSVRRFKNEDYKMDYKNEDVEFKEPVIYYLQKNKEDYKLDYKNEDVEFKEPVIYYLKKNKERQEKMNEEPASLFKTWNNYAQWQRFSAGFVVGVRKEEKQNGVIRSIFAENNGSWPYLKNYVFKDWKELERENNKEKFRFKSLRWGIG